MKHQLKTLFAAILSLFICSSIVNAQISTSALDSRVIHPFGTAFNFGGKFTGVGESGGVPGATADGCDLYGFRAQINPELAVNLGLQRLSPSSSTYAPTLSWDANFPFWFVDKSPSGNSNGPIYGCGKVLGYFFDSPTSDVVFRIYGSGVAQGGMWMPSDARLKRDIENIPSATEIVKSLRGVTYEYRTDEFPQLSLNKGKQYGFLTQEVKEVMPEIVQNVADLTGGEDDHEVMLYTAIIPVLTEAIKEQQEVIETQTDRLAEQLEVNQELEDLLVEQQSINNQQTALIEKLEARLQRLESALGQATPADENVQSAEITPGNQVSLRQNRPNPFKGMTTIEYTLPVDMENIRLVVYDLNGKAMSAFNIDGGTGQVELDASKLSSGVYLYTLEDQNGQALARQKMIVK